MPGMIQKTKFFMRVIKELHIEKNSERSGASNSSVSIEERMLKIYFFFINYCLYLLRCFPYLTSKLASLCLICMCISFPLSRSILFVVVVVIYFQLTISLMHQLIKIKCELTCQHSLRISVSFCFLKTYSFLQQPAMERIQARNQ